MRRLAAIAALLVLVPSAPARADTPEPAAGADAKREIDTLLARCAKTSGLFARFTEEKKITLLSAPLRSEGTVHFARGQGLVRHTEKPSRQSVLLSEKDVLFWDGKTVKRLDVDSSPALGAFARSFSWLLSGNRSALEGSFALEWTGRAADRWSLTLVPKERDLARVISTIAVEGNGNVVSVVRVKEANGDSSTTTFRDVDTDRHYGDADRVFRVPPP